MRTDRRGFLRVAGAVVAWLTGGAVPARARVDPAQEIHQATRNTRLGALGESLWRPSFRAGRAKRYEKETRFQLPARFHGPGRPLLDTVRAYAPPAGFDGALISVEQFSRLLYLAYGVTGGTEKYALRAAPSAGALYAGEVYVVAERVNGLAPGVYYFRVNGQKLVRLRDGYFAKEVLAAVEQPGRIDRAAAYFLLTNVFQRYTRRYRNRGYRYALIDSGHIDENLRLAASAAQLAETVEPRFHDDALNNLLGIDGSEEAVCALHAVGAAAAAAPIPPRVIRLVERHRAGPLPEIPAGPQRYHQQTKLVPVPQGIDLGDDDAPAPAADSAPKVSGAPLALPRLAKAGDLTLDEVISRRRSAGTLRQEPISLAQLAGLCELARGRETLARTPWLDLYAIVHRVEGVAPGLYRYASAAHRLEPLRVEDLRDSLHRVCLRQDKVREAAVAFFMVGELARASAAGARSYRDLLVDAGAVGQRLYLAAEAQDLAARNLAAFVDDDLNALLGLDGVRRAVVHLTVVGPGD